LNPLIWWKLRRRRTVLVEGHPVLVMPGVMDPVLFRTGAWFARWVSQQNVAGKSLLDLGCGTGVVGVLAQAAGARVVASDVDPRACRVARKNGLGQVHERDLFAGTGTHQIICFNPPYFVGTSDDHRLLGTALYGGKDLELIRRFASTVRDHLTPNGVAWVVLSEVVPQARVALGAGWVSVESGESEGERLTVWSTHSGVP
jgi:methylase of polypeptide subunit release factors